MKKAQKNADFFSCKSCDFNCCKKSDMDRHVLTAKHKNRTFLNAGDAKKFICRKCQKTYSARNSLWYHEQKCNIIAINVCDTETTQPVEKETTPHANSLKEIMNYLIKENSELKNMMFEVVKNGTHNVTHNLNSNNKSFNLNFFLNETCKDAMNMTDFVNSLKIQLSDLENVGEVGFVNGITNIIVKNLKSLDVTQRPIHCTDSKREVLYVKDENKWEKDNEENKKIRRVIKSIAYKNTFLLKDFREKHPDCGKSESKYSDQYNKLVIEAMGGRGDNDVEKENKIIKNIVKEVIIEK